MELVNLDLLDRVGASLEAEDEELDTVSGSAYTIDTSGATDFFETAKGSPGAAPGIKLVARQVGGRAERVVVDDLLDFEERREVLIAQSNEERSRKKAFAMTHSCLLLIYVVIHRPGERSVQYGSLYKRSKILGQC